MTEARQTLFKHVMPLLLICALVSLVVGLIELLLLLCAVCFADHIKVKFIFFFRMTHSKAASREETDYRFDIILYTHRIFQMFEFPAMDILASKNKTR